MTDSSHDHHHHRHHHHHNKPALHPELNDDDDESSLEELFHDHDVQDIGLDSDFDVETIFHERKLSLQDHSPTTHDSRDEKHRRKESKRKKDKSSSHHVESDQEISNPLKKEKKDKHRKETSKKSEEISEPEPTIFSQPIHENPFDPSKKRYRPPFPPQTLSSSIQTQSYLNAVTFVEDWAGDRSALPRVVSASADSTLHINDISTGNSYGKLSGHTDRIICLAVSDLVFKAGTGKHTGSSKLLHIAVTGSRDEVVCIWELESFKRLHCLHAHQGPIWAVAVAANADGSGVALSASNEGTIRIWDIVSGNKIGVLKGHSGPIKVLRVFSPYDRPEEVSVLSGGADKVVRIWDLAARSHVRMFEGHEEEITAIEARTFLHNSCFSTIPSEDPYSSTNSSQGEGRAGLSFSPTKNQKQQQQPSTTNKKKNKSNRISPVPGKSGSGSEAPTFTSIVVSGSKDTTIRVWNFESGSLLFELLGHTSSVEALGLSLSAYDQSYSPDSPEDSLPPSTPIIVSASDDATVRVWNLYQGKLTRTFRWHETNVRGLCVFPINKEEAEFVNPEAGYTSGAKIEVTAVCSRRSMQQQVLVGSCGWDRTLQIHDLDDMLREAATAPPDSTVSSNRGWKMQGCIIS